MWVGCLALHGADAKIVDMDKIVYQANPVVVVATNTFIGVPVVLQFDDTPLISVVREENLGFTTEVPIYHEDGTYLAKVRGTRIYPTESGKKAGLDVRQYPDSWACEINKRTAFEIRHQPGDTFRASAELYTPEGYFVKTSDAPMPELFDASGNALKVGGVTMSGNTFKGVRIGVWIKSDGSLSLGVM